MKSMSTAMDEQIEEKRDLRTKSVFLQYEAEILLASMRLFLQDLMKLLLSSTQHILRAYLLRELLKQPNS